MAEKQQTPSEDHTIANITKGWILQQEEQEEMQKVMEEGILGTIHRRLARNRPPKWIISLKIWT
jgi:hypothetical protein